MTPDQARQVSERLGNAKNELLAAIKIAERSSSAKLACQIGALCGRTEVLQNRVSAKMIAKPLSYRQIDRALKREAA